MAKLTWRTCQINWALYDIPLTGDPVHPHLWNQTKKVGCWDLLAYNTDTFFSSTVYQRETDGRCALVFSGYHGSLAGYIRAALALTYPLTTVDMCGYQVYAPYVRLFRHHTSLGNWSKLMHALAGPNRVCKGEPMLAAESMGGSTGEILAACANAGRLDELMPKGMPDLKLKELWTFGSLGAATVPINNTLGHAGCFKGKRVFFQGDIVAGLGSLTGMQHARMDAVEIWPSRLGLGSFTQPTAKAIPCNSQKPAVFGDLDAPPPSPTKAKQDFAGERDPLEHSVTSYADELKWLHNAGMDNLFTDRPAVNPNLLEYLFRAGKTQEEAEGNDSPASERFVSEYDLLPEGVD